MSEVLTQEEVDSLLDGLSSGDVPSQTDAPSGSDDVQLYDFASQEKVIRGRMPTFEVINERFSREVRSSLSMLLHTSVDITSESLDTLKFSEFGRSLPVPTSLHMFRMEPLRGHALLVLESQLVFNLIDTFFGGSGDNQARVEGREFTPIEETMIRKVVTRCLADLEVAWSPVEPIRTTLVRSEVNPQFASVVLPTDSVIVSRFEVELEQVAGKLLLCLPYSMIEPLRSRLASGFQAEDESVDHVWQGRLLEVIGESEVEVSVELGRVEITGERLITMKPGDVIPLDQDADHPLTAYVAGVGKIRGHAGVKRGLQAFRVTEKLMLGE